MNEKKVKVCITGSNGFIGTHLKQRLLQNSKLEVVPFVGDLLSVPDIEKFFAANPDIEQIIHLVGAFSGPISLLFDLNVKALGNLLEVAKGYKVNKVILTSTGAVYGEPIGDCSKEDDELFPNTEYGLTKMLGEELVTFYGRQYNIDGVILRFPNVYGPGNEKGVIGAFKKSILENKSITLFGDGTQSRNFLHVEDACKAMETAIFYHGSGVFNISNPRKVTINELIDLYRQSYDFEVIKKPQNNMLKDLLLDTSKAEKELNFSVIHKEIEL